MTKERPILFSGPMVRAILDGRKTQTRRVVKIPGLDFIGGLGDSRDDPNNWGFEDHEYGGWWVLGDGEDGMGANSLPRPYAVGDQLWVREAWKSEGAYYDNNQQHIRFRAGGFHSFVGIRFPEPDTYWRPSIHMPRAYARILLRVTGVRVERLQDISADDAKAEGLARISKDQGRTYKYGVPDADGLPGVDDHGWPWQKWQLDPREAFHALWDSLNAKRGHGWTVNPWVWVIEFERIRPNHE